MPKHPHASPSWLREFYFWSGIVATICYRAIVILNHYSTTVSLAAWYLGTLGFIIYFYHRYQVSERRAKLIKQYHLLGKIKRSSAFSKAEKEASDYVLGTLISTKEKWNYVVIFVTSILALGIGVYLDFLQK